jgi:hypothetical protein
VVRNRSWLDLVSRGTGYWEDELLVMVTKKYIIPASTNATPW